MMDDKTIYQLLDAFYKGDITRIPLPQGLSERLESAIDRHITTSTTCLKPFTKTKIRYIRFMSAAAVALLCIGLFFITDKKKPYIADTFTNPEEAALAVEQALLLVSSKLNQGLSPFEKVRESVQKTNELINENITIN